MKARKFLHELRHDDIVQTVRDAEQKTSGEIRVFISRHSVEDPIIAAQEAFQKLGMERTQDHNGVLIFVAPRSHNFAVVGDTGVHARCGDSFWTSMTAEMSVHFKRQEFTRGILLGVKKAGDLLARHFPRRPDDQNELSDQIAGD
jgi:uncharacterized membrane protein